MKKYRFFQLLILFITSFSFAQLENMTITDIITINSGEHLITGTPITVPNGKLWVINHPYSMDREIGIIVEHPQFDRTTYEVNRSFTGPFFLTEGMKISFIYKNVFQILEYDAPSTFDGTLAIEESSFQKDNLILFPNPTDSKLTINSEKIFKIEVYDLNGRKLIESNGNSINFSELSSSVYIVKLFNEENTVVSLYKVIKK